jgi:hypothetical protein
MVDSQDRKAMVSAISAQIRAQILGIFGDEEEKKCVAKLHSMVELCNALNINMNVLITTAELTKSLLQYQQMEKEEDTPP